MDTVGERLTWTRKNILNMNQKAFSQLLCISQGALSDIENNNRGLPTEAVIELLKYSKADKRVSCEWILTGTITEDSHEKSATDSNKQLTNEENELISTYRKLDSRGRYKVQTVAYDELDRIEKAKEICPKNKQDIVS